MCAIRMRGLLSSSHECQNIAENEAIIFKYSSKVSFLTGLIHLDDF